MLYNSLTDAFCSSVQVEKSVKEPKAVDKVMQELSMHPTLMEAVWSAIDYSSQEMLDTGKICVSH